jgi:hypothetical protein
MLKMASISLDHMNVAGDARALICDNSEPGKGSVSDGAAGTNETRASRK